VHSLLTHLADPFHRVAIEFLVKIILFVVPSAVVVFRTGLPDLLWPALFTENPEATMITTPTYYYANLAVHVIVCEIGSTSLFTSIGLFPCLAVSTILATRII